MTGAAGVAVADWSLTIRLSFVEGRDDWRAEACGCRGAAGDLGGEFGELLGAGLTCSLQSGQDRATSDGQLVAMSMLHLQDQAVCA